MLESAVPKSRTKMGLEEALRIVIEIIMAHSTYATGAKYNVKVK